MVEEPYNELDFDASKPIDKSPGCRSFKFSVLDVPYFMTDKDPDILAMS